MAILFGRQIGDFRFVGFNVRRFVGFNVRRFVGFNVRLC